MNQAKRSVVETYPHDSQQHSVVHSICRYSVDKSARTVEEKWPVYRRVLKEVQRNYVF